MEPSNVFGSPRVALLALLLAGACHRAPAAIAPAPATAPTQPSSSPGVRPNGAGTGGAGEDPNPAGTTLRKESAFADRSPPQGWTQCAGFVNTAEDDVGAGFLDNCLQGTRLRVRVYVQGDLEEDVYVVDLGPIQAWPSFQYLTGASTVVKRTHWGTAESVPSVLFSDDAGRDACMNPVSPKGTTLGSGYPATAIIAGGAAGYDEYRISCGGSALPGRSIAVYR